MNFWGFGMGMLGPLYAVFALDVGASIMDASWVYALYLACMGVGIIIVGKIGDEKGHEKILVLGYGLSTVSAFGYILVDSLNSLIVVQVLMGISTALLTPAWYALYDRYSGDGTKDGYVWGLSSGLWYIFQGIAMIIGGWIVTAYSFDMLFICMGIVLTLSTIYQAQILKYRVQ